MRRYVESKQGVNKPLSLATGGNLFGTVGACSIRVSLSQLVRVVVS